MTSLRHMVTPHERLVQAARPIVPRARRRREDVAPVESRRAHPAAWARARRLAGGDTRRLAVDRDGSVTVHNGRIR